MDVNMRMIVSSEAKEQQQRNPLSQNTIDGMGAAEEWQSITEAQDNSIDSLKNNTALMKEFGNIMPEIIKNLRAMNDVVSRTSQNLPAIGKVKSSSGSGSSSNVAEKSLLQTINTGGSIIQSAGNGDFGGAIVSGIGGVSNLTNNLSSAANSSGLSSLGKLLGKASIATAIIGAAVGVGKKFFDSYQDAMPTIFGTGKAFGTTDSDMSMLMYHTVNDYNIGTGLNNDEFNSLIVSLRKQGVGNGLKSKIDQASLAGSIAETSSKWAYATGGDASQFAGFAGLMSRYGKSGNVAEDMNYVMNAGLATGLNQSQLPEFLSSIEKIMEDGIAKGFSRSATDVANTMLMFSKMSGNNAFWQGEQGAKILNQVNQGLSGATSLSKTSDIIAYRAMAKAYSGVDENGVSKAEKALGDLYLEDGDYINTMMLMERGVDADNFSAIMCSINESTGSTTGRIERIRQMFGVNYTGAARLMELNPELYTSKEELQKEIEKIKNAPENQNNETRWQQAVNKIQEAMQDKGQGLYDNVLGIVENTSKIVDLLGGDELPTEDATVVDPLFGKEAAEGTYRDIQISKSEKGKQRAYLSGALGPQEYYDYITDLTNGNESDYQNFMDFIFNPETKESKTLAENLANTIDWETHRGTSFKEDRDRPDTDDNSVKYYIKALYDLWEKFDKQGIELH